MPFITSKALTVFKICKQNINILRKNGPRTWMRKFVKKATQLTVKHFFLSPTSLRIWEMQFETAVWLHFLLTSLTHYEKENNTQFRWKERTAFTLLHLLLVRIKIGTIFLKGNLVIFIRTLKTSYSFDLELHLLGIYPKEIIRDFVLLKY